KLPKRAGAVILALIFNRLVVSLCECTAARVRTTNRTLSVQPANPPPYSPAPCGRGEAGGASRRKARTTRASSPRCRDDSLHSGPKFDAKKCSVRILRLHRLRRLPR